MATLTDYLPSGYTPQNMRGGYGGFVFIKKSELANLTINDETSWTTLIGTNAANDAKIFGRYDCEDIDGEKPAAQQDTIETGACRAKKTISATETFSFEDVGFDSDLTVFNLYDFLRDSNNTKDYLFAAIDTDGYMTPFMNPTHVTTDYVKQKGNNTLDMHTLTVEVRLAAGYSLKPTLLPFINDIAASLAFDATV